VHSSVKFTDCHFLNFILTYLKTLPSHGTQSEDGEGHKIEINPSPIGRDHESFFKRDSRSRGSLQEIPQQGAGSSGAPLRWPVATNKSAVEISTKDRDNQ
jgi:hypothetical protein